MEFIFFVILILIINLINIISNNLIIYPLNEIEQSHTLDSYINYTYYFFSSIKNVKLNEPISYLIDPQITDFDFSYAFLEKENSDDIKEEDIKKYSFNETSSILDLKMYFKGIIKTNDNQKGLLLKMKLNKVSGDNFTISRINVTILGIGNKTIKINKNENQYFYLGTNGYGYLQKYDILIHSSYNQNRKIKYYYQSIFGIIYYNYASYIYISEDSNSEIEYINIKANETESIYLCIQYFEKNILEVEKELQTIKKIELNTLYPQKEKYFIIDYSQISKSNIFFDKKYGEFESYYIFLKEVNILDDIFSGQQKMKKFDSPLILENFISNPILIYFKCLNDLPLIIDLYIYIYEDYEALSEERVNNIIIHENEEKDVPIIKDISNLNISFEYIGCILGENDSINIQVNENEFNLTKSHNKQLVSNINNVKGDVYHIISYSEKICYIKVKFGNIKNLTIYPLQEYNSSQLSSKSIFVSPKIEEDYHYIVYDSKSSEIYYDDIDNGIISYYHYISNDKLFYKEIKANPYKNFKGDKSMTHLIYFSSPKSFYIKKIKEEKARLNEVFEMDDFTEYYLPENLYENAISVQIFDSETKFPLIRTYNYEFKIDDDYPIQAFRRFKGEAIKILNIESKRLVKICNINITYQYIYFNFIYYPKYDALRDSKKRKMKFIIEPLLENKKIKYMIHYLEGGKEDNNLYKMKIFNNFGGISQNKTFEKIASSDFEYVFKDLKQLYISIEVIGIDLETGYLYTYRQGIIRDEEFDDDDSGGSDNNHKNHVVVFVVIGIVVFLILVIVIIIVIMKKRKGKNLSLDIESNNRLMD